MELKSPKAKKKSPIAWKKMLRSPALLLLLLGSINCDIDSDLNLEHSNSSQSDLKFRHRHEVSNDSFIDKKVLSEIKYLRRHLNKEIINFVMTDVLIDGEIENRVHFNGVTAKETFVGVNGSGLKLRQLTDGRHLIQIIYTPNGAIQDCEYIREPKSARNFLKTLRKELKLALDEETYRITDKRLNTFENEKFYRHFGNVTFRILKDGEKLPPDVADWLNYDRLKNECFERHEELTYMMENRNKLSDATLSRFRACLKLADTSVSNMVGKLFFNIVQTKCFILKPVKMCTQRSWWGKCLRRGYMKQAFLRDNLPY
ncbi:uncharacterized protein LOC126779581 isoform X4 [Nymphalis io]|uniref:uncharacterized protein LOC126779581 isoform X4 n=1 Tax=Inachis io TaxID=171585 RepID=UPI0021682ED7|nr:uncharacterized protein LOC126779581 isoform X4 [Nymphalis io]